MKNTSFLILTLALLTFAPIVCQAQYGEEPETTEERTFETAGNVLAPMKKKSFTITSSAEASMFQLALLDIGGNSDLSTLRYTYFFNIGSNFNKKINDNLEVFSGIGIKNLGFIIKDDTSTHKYRAYTVGIPVGLKIGNPKKSFFIIGGGVDIPFNYREKHWTKRNDKTKSNEWFSNKINPILPYANIGYRLSNSMTFKAYYYPTNFWSDNYYNNAKANLMVLTFGYDILRNGIVNLESVEKVAKKSPVSLQR